MPNRLLPLVLLLTCACQPLFFEPLSDANGSETLGERGPFAVESLTRELRVRTDETIRINAFFPVDGVQAPLALVVHGGSVSPERYYWLGEHLASRGMATVLPHHALDLAIFEGANASDAARVVKRLALEEDDIFFDRVSQEPGLITGHSLGGVVALSSWLNDPQSFSHVAALAGIPNPGSDFSHRESQVSARVLSIVGTLDGSISPDEVLDGFDAVETGGTLVGVPVQQVRVEGMTHFQFTDDPTESDLAKEESATTPVQQARQAALFLVDAAARELITSTLEPSIFDDTSLWPEGLIDVSTNESEQ